MEVLRLSNKYIDETAPWVLAKDEKLKDRLETVIYNLLESIRVCGLILSCVIPSSSDEIIRQLGIDDKSLEFNENNNYQLIEPTPIFKRIDIK